MRIFVEFWMLLRDVALAFWHTLTRQPRNIYAARIDIRAPRDAVWRLIAGHDVTFEDAGLRVRLTPLPDIADSYKAEIAVHGAPVRAIAYQQLRIVPNELHVSRYLPEHSDAGIVIGDNDVISILLGDGPEGATRVAFARELTHTSFATRISAPMGVRQAAWLIGRQAERDAGVLPKHRSAASHAWMTLLALASFVWIAGPVDGLILMVLIATHEGGHALAMLRYGLGVSFVGFIPFLGGMAAPTRRYVNDCQHGIVALMGVGISLPVTFGLFVAAGLHQSAALANAAALFSIVNGANLLPLPGLDGGIVARLVSERIHPKLSSALMWLMMAAFVALAVWLASPWIWLAVVFGFVQLIVLSSIDHRGGKIPLTGLGAIGLSALYVALFAAYLTLSVMSLGLARDLQRLDDIRPRREASPARPLPATSAPHPAWGSSLTWNSSLAWNGVSPGE